MPDIDEKSNLDEGYVKMLLPAGCVNYCPNWLQSTAADELLTDLKQDLDWQSRTIKMFGRELLQPRLICFQGEKSVKYRYSGGDYVAQTWHPAVAVVRNALRVLVESSNFNQNFDPMKPELKPIFNSVLINLYRDGQDSMGWHSDDERELGKNPLISSISLGQERRFSFRNKATKQRFDMLPAHGSLILMAGDLQHHWQHQLPKSRKTMGARINLTFRTIRS